MTYTDLVACVDAWVVRAVAENELHHTFDALTALARAVQVARPHHLVRPSAVTAPDRVHAMIPNLADWLGGWDDFTKDLQCGPSGRPGRSAGPEALIEPLTRRELAILAALPSSNTYAELATEFFITRNTIKAHLQAVYRKLGVSTRRKAVERARDLCLLP